MNDYNSNYRGGGQRSGGFRGRSGGGGRGFNRRDEGPRMMHKATCAECGRECEVPFRPSGERPVYCSNCFEKRSETGRPQFQERRSDYRPVNQSREGQSNNGQIMQEIRNLNAKVDRILNVLEPKPTHLPKEAQSEEISIIDSIVAAPEVQKNEEALVKAKKPKTSKKKEPAIKPEA